MAAREKKSPEEQARILGEIHRERKEREKSYRGRALRLFPHLCARCGREFEGKRLRELTVHHRDHNHQNNPPDGSNWELLCLYCHDNEHEKQKMKGYAGGSTSEAPSPSGFTPFGALDDLLGSGDTESGDEDQK